MYKYRIKTILWLHCKKLTQTKILTIQKLGLQQSDTQTTSSWIANKAANFEPIWIMWTIKTIHTGYYYITKHLWKT